MRDQVSLKEKDGGVVIPVRVQPRAAHASIAGAHGGALKLKITAPPVDGEANRACTRMLSDLFRIAPSRIQILNGHKDKNKVFLLEGVSVPEIENRLQEVL
jgi:uncharacterized protein (TIGR00251 family)